MSKRLKGIVFKAVILCLLSVCCFAYGNKFSIKSNNNNKQIEQIQIKAKEEIEDLNMKQNILKNTLKECSKLQIAEGSLDMSYRFSNDIPEITDGDKYSPFVAIKQTLTHRNFIYNAVYKYNFKMDLSKIDTKIENNNIIITLTPTYILLEDVREETGTVSIIEDTGLLARNLKSNEVISMKELCKTKAYNTIITDSDLKNEALKCLEKSMHTLCDNLHIKNYKINIIEENTLMKKDAHMTINHQEQNNKINLSNNT